MTDLIDKMQYLSDNGIFDASEAGMLPDFDLVAQTLAQLRHENDCLQATIAQIEYPCSPHCHGYLREQKLLRDALRAQQHAEALAEALTLWQQYDDMDEADFSGVGPMTHYANAINATRAALAAYRSVK